VILSCGALENLFRQPLTALLGRSAGSDARRA